MISDVSFLYIKKKESGGAFGHVVVGGDAGGVAECLRAVSSGGGKDFALRGTSQMCWCRCGFGAALETGRKLAFLSPF